MLSRSYNIHLGRNHNRHDWQLELSFPNLLSQGLVQNRAEWRSLRTAFQYKNVPPVWIKTWLKKQKGHFRKCYLTEILLSGYLGTSKTPLSYKDIIDIIIQYVNIVFVRLFNNVVDSFNDCNQPELRTFDCNLSINNLCKIFERERHLNRYQNTMKLSTRFDALKFIFNTENGPGACTKSYEKYYNLPENAEDKERWTEIPTNLYSALSLRDIDDNLRYDQVLEIKCDKLDKFLEMNFAERERKLFRNNIVKRQQMIESINKMKRFEWICSLNVGDIVDVFNNGLHFGWMEGVIFGRDFDTFYVYCYGESGNGFKVEIKSISGCIDRLQPRFSRCNSVGQLNIRKTNRLVFCEWVTAFTSYSAHYPILIE